MKQALLKYLRFFDLNFADSKDHGTVKGLKLYIKKTKVFFLQENKKLTFAIFLFYRIDGKHIFGQKFRI
jgi:hypothetical protein